MNGMILLLQLLYIISQYFSNSAYMRDEMIQLSQIYQSTVSLTFVC